MIHMAMFTIMDKLIKGRNMGIYSLSICNCNRTTCLSSYMTSLNQDLQNATKVMSNKNIMICHMEKK